MSTLTLQFIDRSMDYVHRQLELLEWARNISDDADLFKHVELSVDMLAQFMEGSETFELFDRESINRFVNDKHGAGVWPFIQGMQQYVFAGFAPGEVSDIARQLAFSIAPNKMFTDKGINEDSPGNDYSQSPIGTVTYANRVGDILNYLYANPWLMPLVSLGMSRELPTFAGGTDDGK